MSNSVDSVLDQLDLFAPEIVISNAFLKDPIVAASFVEDNFSKLTPYQKAITAALVNQYTKRSKFERNAASDLVSVSFLEIFGDEIRKHHSTSRQPLGKDKFEFALETACTHSGKLAKLSSSRTLAGADIIIEGTKYSLKTESAKDIKGHELLISKYMELGKGAWNYEFQREQFFQHLHRYDRILQFRCLKQGPTQFIYELVEIPKSLLMESRNFGFETVVERDEVSRKETDEKSIRSASCRVLDDRGEQKFSLYFDGKGERKLTIKQIQKRYCISHATWWFESDIF